MGDPIFIGGMFKSGTSLLRAMLGQHPNIAAGLETYWFDLEMDNREMNPNSRAALERYSIFFSIEFALLESYYFESGTAEQFLDRMMRRVAADQGAGRWAEKTPANVANTERIWRHWPEAPVLHIVRDPRDVYASLVQIGKWDAPEEFAIRWEATVGSCERSKTQPGFRLDRYLETRYEDLVLRPEITMRNVQDFVGEEWVSSVAQFDGVSGEFEKVELATGKQSPTLRRLQSPLSRDRIGIWSRTLTESQVSELEACLNDRGLGEYYLRIASETPTS